jgi:hypothetical protein
MKNILKILLIMLGVSIPNIASANEPQIVPINEGELAPFSGVLLNNAAAAASISSTEEAQERCQIKVDTELELLRVRHLRDIEIMDAKLDFCEDTKEKILDLQDEYIQLLETQATKKRIPPEVIFGIGVVSGVGLTIGAGYALGQVTNGIQ